MNITYNNETPEDYGCWLATRPVVTPSEVEVDRYKIPNRRGELLGNYETRGNAKISFTLHQKATPNNLEKAMVWLRNSGGQLIMSDDTDFYYEVLQATATAYQNKADDYKRIEVELEIYPFKFRINPTVEYTIPPSTAYSFTLDSDTCEPQYNIQRLVDDTEISFTVNGGRAVKLGGTLGQVVQLDVRRKKAFYRGESADNIVDVDYDSVKLVNGANTITTSAGITVHVISKDGYII